MFTRDYVFNDRNGVAQVVIVVGQLEVTGSNYCDVEVIVDEALPDSGVEQRRLVSGIGADQQNLVSLFYSCDARVQKILRPEISAETESMSVQLPNHPKISWNTIELG